MNKSTAKAVDSRLARIEGQVRGLRRMLQSGEYCCDILTQIAATKSALERVGAELAAGHVRTCIMGHEGHEKSKKMSQEEMLEELRTTLHRLVR